MKKAIIGKMIEIAQRHDILKENNENKESKHLFFQFFINDETF